MGISKREQAIYARVETTPGTYLAPAGADILQVSNLQANPAENLRWIDRTIIRSSLNPSKGVYGGALFGLQFDIELKGSGTAGTAPRLGRVLRACGLQETVVASTSVTYRPQSTLSLHDSLSIGFKQGGIYRTLKGCRGTFSLAMKTGEIALATVKLLGRVNTETDAAAPSPTEETTIPPPFLSATFQVGGFAAPIESMALDVSNTMSISPNPNNSDGYGEIRVTARKTSLKLNPELETIATKDWIGLWRAGTTQAVQTGVIGGTAGNRWAVSAPNAYIMTPAFGDREELLTVDLDLGAAESSGDDEFSIQFT